VAKLIKNGKVVWRARVGVGQRQWPTPKGQFFIRAELRGYGSRGSFYGPVAFITSATSDVLTDWPGGGIVGVHGTSLPGLIPGRISHGCVRVRNADILRLARLMPVGTPLTIT
jgi:lipoprotein-anchoring transpeptidase ErfK/SrfK